jgi:hypothetical protein
MRKVPPILKPIALLTISTIIATATGVVNSSSYRQPSRASHSTEVTETTEKGEPDQSQSVDSQPVSENTVPSTTVEDQEGASSSITNNQRTVPSSSIEDNSTPPATDVPSSDNGQSDETAPSSQGQDTADQEAVINEKQENE